jgi:hypothetical protein
MIRSHRTWGTALLLATAQAAAVAAVAPEVAQDLAKKSGLLTQLDSLGTQVRTGMAAAMARDPRQPGEPQKTRMLDCAQAAYAADGLRPPALDAVAATLQPADVAPLQSWYESPLGRKIAAMEASSGAQATDPQERLRRGADALSGASEARKGSLQAILTETHSVDIMADTLIEMALAVQQGMANADPSAPGPSAAELKGNLSSRRPQLLAHYGQIAVPAYAFTYRELGDDELKQYADYLGSPAATAFSDGSTRGVARAMNAGSVRFGRCLKEPEAKKAP